MRLGLVLHYNSNTLMLFLKAHRTYAETVTWQQLVIRRHVFVVRVQLWTTRHVDIIWHEQQRKKPIITTQTMLGTNLSMTWQEADISLHFTQHNYSVHPCIISCVELTSSYISLTPNESLFMIHLVVHALAQHSYFYHSNRSPLLQSKTDMASYQFLITR